MGRSERTARTWPDETPEEVIERTLRDHGVEAAAIVAKALGASVVPRRRVPEVVGVRPKHPAAIPRLARRSDRADAVGEWGYRWDQSNRATRGRVNHNRSGLPRSGADLPPGSRA